MLDLLVKLFVDGHVMRSNKSECSLDCGPVGVDVFFVTLFLKANARIYKSMSQLHLEILDYCLLKDDSLDKNENLVTIGVNFLIPREDMVSLAGPLRIRWCIIDCYCLYLNEKACFEVSGPRKFFFGVRQSFAFLHVCDHIGQGDISSAVKDLHELWESWMLYENPECDLMAAELCDQMGAFLGKRNHPKSSHLPSYGFEVVDLEWRNKKIDNLDCGVFVMYHMLHFVGESFTKNELKTIAGRKFLGGEICTTLVLCDLNESRNDVLVELAKFNEKKKDGAYVQEIEERRKAAIAEKKKKAIDDRKMAAEAAAKAKAETEADEEQPKGKRAKKQTKKYTPSKQ